MSDKCTSPEGCTYRLSKQGDRWFLLACSICHNTLTMTQVIRKINEHTQLKAQVEHYEEHWDAMEQKCRRLEAQVERLQEQLHPKHKCVSCGRMTNEISFRLGYGSVHDGGEVCWKCAGKFDVLLGADD